MELYSLTLSSFGSQDDLIELRRDRNYLYAQVRTAYGIDDM